MESKHMAIDPAGIKADKLCIAYDPCFVFKGFDAGDYIEIDSLFYGARYSKHPIDTVILEEGFLNTDLAEARRAIENSALRQGLKVIRVMPRTWQTIYKQHKPPFKGAKPKSKWYARTVMGLTLPKKNTHDYADAACMWQWYKLKLEKGAKT